MTGQGWITKMQLGWKISESDGSQSVLEFLRGKKDFSKRLIKQLKRTPGGITVNNEEVTVRKHLKLNDELVIRIEEKRNHSFSSKQIPLHIIFEDEHVLVVNKEAGLLSIPTRDCDNSLANGILYYYDQQELPYTVHIVTRLDRDTSGLVLIAKHRYAHHRLAKLQQRQQIKRTYEAIVQGEVIVDKGTIDLPIDRDENSLVKRKVSTNGKYAVTHFHKIQSKNNKSLLEVSIETGRTHQIRVHLSSLGYPIIGDTLYGDDRNDLGYHCLHCKKLEFIHPFTEELLCFGLSAFNPDGI